MPAVLDWWCTRRAKNKPPKTRERETAHDDNTSYPPFCVSYSWAELTRAKVSISLLMKWPPSISVRWSRQVRKKKKRMDMKAIVHLHFFRLMSRMDISASSNLTLLLNYTSCSTSTLLFCPGFSLPRIQIAGPFIKYSDMVVIKNHKKKIKK